MENEKNELIKIVEESRLEKTKADFLLSKFTEAFELASKWERNAKLIKVENETQVSEMKLARIGRIELQKKRIDIEKTRKELKEQSLREGKAIDGIANVLKSVIIPIEKYLDSQEHFIENKAKAEKERLFQEEQKRLEDERILEEKRKEKEFEKQKIENEKMKKELKEKEEEREKRENEIQLEREKQEKILQEQKQKAEKIIKEEREKREKENEIHNKKIEELKNKTIICPYCKKEINLGV